jgi:hypothetical protein
MKTAFLLGLAVGFVLASILSGWKREARRTESAADCTQLQESAKTHRKKSNELLEFYGRERARLTRENAALQDRTK